MKFGLMHHKDRRAHSTLDSDNENSGNLRGGKIIGKKKALPSGRAFFQYSIKNYSTSVNLAENVPEDFPSESPVVVVVVPPEVSF